MERGPNLCTLDYQHNPPICRLRPVLCSAGHQRWGAALGSGNAEPAGAGAVSASFGFLCLGRIGLRGGFGGGPAGRNSANTGLGSTFTVPDENMPPSVRKTFTGTEAGSKPGIA